MTSEDSIHVKIEQTRLETAAERKRLQAEYDAAQEAT